jgi:hypothetical protein
MMEIDIATVSEREARMLIASLADDLSAKVNSAGLPMLLSREEVQNYADKIVMWSRALPSDKEATQG